MIETTNKSTIFFPLVAFIAGYAIVSLLFSRARKPSKSEFTEKRQNEETSGANDEWKRGGEERKRYNESHHESKHNDNYNSYESTRDNASERDETYYSRVLGLSGCATISEVKSQYRKLAIQYHPDKVNCLGPKLRELAEKEMKEINMAYEFFKRKYGT